MPDSSSNSCSIVTLVCFSKLELRFALCLPLGFVARRFWGYLFSLAIKEFLPELIFICMSFLFSLSSVWFELSFSGSMPEVLRKLACVCLTFCFLTVFYFFTVDNMRNCLCEPESKLFSEDRNVSTSLLLSSKFLLLFLSVCYLTLFPCIVPSH